MNLENLDNLGNIRQPEQQQHQKFSKCNHNSNNIDDIKSNNNDQRISHTDDGASAIDLDSESMVNTIRSSLHNY